MNLIEITDHRYYLIKQLWDKHYICEGITREEGLVKVGIMFDAYNTKQHVSEIFDMVWGNADIVIGFPECTDMAVSGAAHFAKKLAANPACQAEAVELAKFVKSVGEVFSCEWMLENPRSILSTCWRKPNFTFDLFEYGGYLPEEDIHPTYPEYIRPRDAYPKKTCIWCSEGFKIPVKKPVYIEPGYSDQHKKLGGKSLKTKNIRSATPRGFAKSVFTVNN